MIDWDVATSTGVRWARPGPQVSRAEARKVVAELRDLAAAVQEPVRQLTGMAGLADGGKIAIVDRPGWIRANVDGFRVVLDPLVERLQQRAPAPGGSVLTAVGSRVTGMQAGLILAYLAGRVLGQYELFLPPDPSLPATTAPAGRLTLVAPNIVMVERELGVDPHDFRRWVCLHEETHRCLLYTSLVRRSRWASAWSRCRATSGRPVSQLRRSSCASAPRRLSVTAIALAVRGRGSNSESSPNISPGPTTLSRFSRPSAAARVSLILPSSTTYS